MDFKLLHDKYEEALEREPEKRVHFLEDLKREHPDVSIRIKRMLSTQKEADQLFERPLMKDSPVRRYIDHKSDHFADSVPEKIGVYTIMQRLGGGGMGEVYQAVMQEPVYREVALKLVKPGGRDNELLQRLQVERQALVQLSHQHVVRVFDVGTSDDGQPFFTMEYLKDGRTLTAWCDEHRAGITDRINLFLQVCEGVIHAHDRGFIHGDLKPSNILVTMQNDRPVVKIIDFGTARSVDPGGPLPAVDDKVFGAPAYISPEQTLAQETTTRGDVYTLGVVLYELLTGTPLADPVQFPQVGDREKIEQIRNLVHPPASSCFKGEAGRVQEIAAKRGVNPVEGAKALSGDLDWILAKALQKDPDQRYGAVRELKADLERARRHEPVSVAPSNRLYQLKKYVRRHRQRVVLAAALVLSVLMVVGVVAISAREQQQIELARQKQDRDFGNVIEGFFSQSMPHEFGMNLSLVEAITIYAAKLKGDPTIDPQLEARFRLASGQVLLGIGEFGEAQKTLERALSIYEGTPPLDAGNEVRALILLSESQRHNHEPQKALTTIQGALAMIRSQPQDSDLASLKMPANRTLCRIYKQMGDHKRAAQLLDAALLELETLKQKDETRFSHDIQNTQFILANLLSEQGRYNQAAERHEKLFQTRLQTYGPDHMFTLESKQYWGYALLRTDDTKKKMLGIRLLEEALPARLEKSGPKDPSLLDMRGKLAQAYADLKRWPEAIATAESVVENFRESKGSNHPLVLRARVSQATVIGQSGDSILAVKLLEEIVPHYQMSSIGLENTDALRAMNNLAHFLNKAERYEQAYDILQKIVRVKESMHGVNSHRTITTQATMAQSLHGMKRLEHAAGLYKSVIERYEETYPKQRSKTFKYRVEYIRCLIEMNRFEPAEKQIGEAENLGIEDRQKEVLDTLRQELEQARAAYY